MYAPLYTVLLEKHVLECSLEVYFVRHCVLSSLYTSETL
jgi:hypothetical protein